MDDVPEVELWEELGALERERERERSNRGEFVLRRIQFEWCR